MKFTVNLIVSTIFITLINGLIAQQSTPLIYNPDASVAQFAISHGHCSLGASAVVNHFKVTNLKDDFSDILINFSIDMNSLKSFDQKTTDNLKSDAIFNTDKNPYMVFQCLDNFKLGEGWFHLRGNFTINGITKYVRLMLNPENSEIKNGKRKDQYFISGDVNLFDYGIDYSDECSGNKTMFINIHLEDSK